MTSNITDVQPDLPSIPSSYTSTSPSSRKTRLPSQSNAAKPSIRAKTGCITCRVRRKKCDEKRNLNGACQTCVRLRIQCLGFHAKRPPWLKSKGAVDELRDLIKCFLVSQGMIKGHVNPAHAYDFNCAQPHEHSGAHPSFQESITTTAANGYSFSIFPTTSSSHSSVPPTRFPLDAHGYLILEPQKSLPSIPPEDGMHTFDDQDDSEEASCAMTVSDSQALRMAPVPRCPPYQPPHRPLSPSKEFTLLAYYFHNVLPAQYILSNKMDVVWIIQPLMSHHLINLATRLLSHLSWSMEGGLSTYETLCQSGHSTIRQLQLRANEMDGRCKATVGLLMVSAILFLGGRCPSPHLAPDCPCNWWMESITTYIFWVVGPESDPETIRNRVRVCQSADRWIVQTGIWFDILYSITTNRPPKLQTVIDALWNPDNQDVTRFEEMSPSTPSSQTMAIPEHHHSYNSPGQSPNAHSNGDPMLSLYDQTPHSSLPNTYSHNVSTLSQYDQTSHGWPSNSHTHLAATTSPHGQTSNLRSHTDLPGLELENRLSTFSTAQTSSTASSGLLDAYYPLTTFSSSSSPSVSPSTSVFPSASILAPAAQARDGNACLDYSDTIPYDTSSNLKPSTNYQPPQENTPLAPYPNSYIPAAQTAPAPPPRTSPAPNPLPLSMLDGMGATPLASWAICQANMMYQLKQEMGPSSSVNEFQQRGSGILTCLGQEWNDYAYDDGLNYSPFSFHPSAQFNTYSHHAAWGENEELKRARSLSARVWRETAKLYLWSVLEDDRPLVTVIQEGVKRTVERVRSLMPSPYPETTRQNTRTTKVPAIRNLYFPIFLAGVLTADCRIQQEVVGFLQLNEKGVGNGREVAQLLHEIWQDFEDHYKQGRTIPWRERLKEKHLLLI